MKVRRLNTPSGGDEAPHTSSPLGLDGPILELIPLASEICRRYQQEFRDERERYGHAGNRWCVHDNQHLLDWAVQAANGDLDIRAEVSWLASVLEARGFPIDRLARTLDLGAEVIDEQALGAPGVGLAFVLTDTAAFVRTHGSFLGHTVGPGPGGLR